MFEIDQGLEKKKSRNSFVYLRNLSKLSSVVVVEKVRASEDLVKSLFEKQIKQNKILRLQQRSTKTRKGNLILKTSAKFLSSVSFPVISLGQFHQHFEVN
jgi:hypothetical protein